MRKILILFFFLISALSNGRTFYLSPVGLDSNTGTINLPFFTLKKAWTVISAGDTIYLRGGLYQYETTQFLTGKNGTSTNPIKIWAYPGEVPVITKKTNFTYTWHSGIAFTGNYFHWRGIEITGFTQTTATIYVGIRVTDASNNIFEQINSHHNGHGCVITGNSGGNLVLNSDFHHNQDPLTTPMYGNADGLEICYIPEGLTNTVKGCRIWWNTDDGIDLWENDGVVIIENCWSWNNGYIPDTFTAAGNGNGFKMGKTVINHGTKVIRKIMNCVSYNNKARGFDENEAKGSMEIYNNTAYLNGTNSYVFNSNGIYSDVRNCVSYQNSYGPAFPSISSVLNCSFSDKNPALNVGALLANSDFLSLDASQLSRPRSNDGSLPVIDFLKPSPGSKLIDKGINAGLPFSGAAPDIGAFETTTTAAVAANQSPAVSISFPTKGASFESPATVDIDVNASDSDGSITKVELYNGSVKLLEKTTAPYSFTLKDLQAGSYDLKAVATDNMQASSTSSSLALTVTSIIEARDYFNLYPNPNNGRFAIEFTTLMDADIFTVTVVDLIGRTVYREELSKDESTRHLDLSHLNSGIYVLMIAADQILLTQKFIKA